MTLFSFQKVFTVSIFLLCTFFTQLSLAGISNVFTNEVQCSLPKYESCWTTCVKGHKGIPSCCKCHGPFCVGGFTCICTETVPGAEEPTPPKSYKDLLALNQCEAIPAGEDAPTWTNGLETETVTD